MELWNFFTRFFTANEKFAKFFQIGGFGGFREIGILGDIDIHCIIWVFNYRPIPACWSILMVHNLITVP